MQIEARNGDVKATMRITITHKGKEFTISGKNPTDVAQKAIDKVLEIEAAANHEFIKDTRAFFKEYAKFYVRTYLAGKKSGSYLKEVKGYLKNYLNPYFGDIALAKMVQLFIQSTILFKGYLYSKIKHRKQ